MMFFAVSTGILLLAAATIAYAVSRFAQKRDDDGDEHHAPEFECDRRVTIEDEHFTIK